MILPFGLKQKPLSKYFEHGVIRFKLNEGVLYFTITSITKSNWSSIYKGKVINKEHLDKLLSIKSLHEIPTIEEVVS